MNRSSTPGRASLSRLFLALVPLGWLLLACSTQTDRSGRDSSRPEPGSQGYQPTDVAEGGTIVGTVELAGDIPPDTTIYPASDQGVCGASVPLSLVETDGRGLGGTVVWLADVRRGKRLPVERRYTLTNKRCLLAPLVQAAIAGGTLNVRSVDAAVHRNRFLRAGDDSTIAKIQLNDEGQVVPLERILAEPGSIEVRCDQHPWTRAWIMVFDQPYFATTERDGGFRMDSVPPGEYRLLAWHPQLGVTEQQIKVEAGKERDVQVKLGR